MSRINIKQKLFLEKYIETGNATFSYIFAYRVKNIKVAEAAASRLLSNVMMQVELEEMRQVISKKYNLTIQTQIAELDELIKSCITEGIDGHGVIKDRTNWNKAIAEKNKLAGLITTKNEHKINAPISINLGFTNPENGENNTDNTNLNQQTKASPAPSDDSQ